MKIVLLTYNDIGIPLHCTTYYFEKIAEHLKLEKCNFVDYKEMRVSKEIADYVDNPQDSFLDDFPEVEFTVATIPDNVSEWQIRLTQCAWREDIVVEHIIYVVDGKICWLKSFPQNPHSNCWPSHDL